MQLKRSKRPALEYLLVVVVVGLAMGMTAALYGKRDQVFKERLLILELQTLRNHSAAYIFEHKALPKDIQWVLSPRSTVHGPRSDPLGYPYRFDAVSGWVATTHPRYKDW